MDAPQAGSLYLDESRILYAGPGLDSDLHEHYAISILIPLEGHIQILRPKSNPLNCQGAIIAANVFHELRAAGSRMIIMQFDPDSTNADAPDVLPPGQVAVIERSRLTDLLPRLEGLIAGDESCREAHDLFDETLKSLGFPVDRAPELDPRIARVVQRLKSDSSEKIPARDLAELAGLSEPRLMALFKQQMGLPIRRYHLWLRLRRAARDMRDGRNLTQAAHDAGFSDSAHLSRTFRNMLGVPPSNFLSSTSPVKAFFCG